MGVMIGLTGPTGAGKSSVAQAVGKLGIKVIDCDTVAREAVEKGSDGLAAVVSAFGQDLLFEDGTLNRRMLARRAFSTPENTKLLNDTLLPHIVRLVKEQAGESDVLVDAPTLFESGMDGECADTVAVLADSDIRLERIIARDGISPEDASIRMNAGKSDDFYIGRAGHILYNNGDGDTFVKEAVALIDELFGGNKNE